MDDKPSGVVKEPQQKMFKFKNKRNHTINFTIGGKNYNAEPSKIIEIPAKDTKHKYFQDIKNDFAEVK
jgi:hypothetical protein